MTPEEKQQHDAAARARAEKIKEDVMHSIAAMVCARIDDMPIDELREQVVKRLRSMPKEERTREVERMMQAVEEIRD
jgi:hypothetical protein